MKISENLSSFIQDAREELAIGENSTFWNRLEDFKNVVLSPEFTEVINSYLKQILKSDSHANLFSAMNNDAIILHEEEKFSIELFVYKRTTEYIYRHPADTIYVILGQGTITGHKYRILPEQSQSSVLTSDTRAELSERRTLARGDVFWKDGITEATDFTDYPKEGMLMVRLVSWYRDSTEWSFERESLRAWNSISVSSDSSQIMSMVALAGALPDTSSLEPLRQVLNEHPDHFVRWSAVRSLLQIDNAIGIEALKKSLHDFHPHVRNAAVKTLAANNIQLD